jgi:hypothetical protein
LLEPRDQKPLMFVLRKDMQERIPREILAHRSEVEMDFPFALHPQIHRGNLVSCLEHRIGEIELTVKLERARMHRQRPRGGSGRGGLVDDAAGDAHLRQPQGQHQSGGPGADNQDVAFFHRHIL